MLLLLFYVGDDRYALESSHVVEIIPKVLLRTVHHAPDYVAGVFNYRGAVVPVVDLCHLIQNSPSRNCLSTRIIMVNYVGQNQVPRLVGLMAERVTETLQQSTLETAESFIQTDAAPYLGGMIMDEKGMIQCIRLEHLLADPAVAYLLPEEGGVTL